MRICLIVLMASPGIAGAQTSRGAGGTPRSGSTARQAIAPSGTALPLARIDDRIPNRVQSRMRTRIDQNYDPQANALSPFVVAGAQVRAAGKPRR